MKKMIIMLLFFTLTVEAQTKCKTRVLYASSELNASNYQELKIKNIRHAFWSDSIVVKTANKKIILPAEKVWGMQDDDCTIYRNYEGEFYKLEQADSLIIYTQVHGGYKGTRVTNYYFSRNLNSPILNLTWKRIKNEYNDNPCFLSEIDKNIKWYEDYNVKDKKTGTFKIVEIYRSCLKK